MYRNTILTCYIKYIFSKTCFTLKLLELCSKFEVDIYKKKEVFVWAQYQTFLLDEISFPIISNVVIFTTKNCMCEYFFQDHLTFSNHVLDFFGCVCKWLNSTRGLKE